MTARENQGLAGCGIVFVSPFQRGISIAILSLLLRYCKGEMSGSETARFDLRRAYEKVVIFSRPHPLKCYNHMDLMLCNK